MRSSPQMILVAGCVLLAPPLAAFCPKNTHYVCVTGSLAGVSGLTHEDITRQAFLGNAANVSLYQTIFGKPVVTRSMEDALNAIVDANAAVDDDQKTSALHFDSENFDGGRNRIRLQLENTVTNLRAGRVGEARITLGTALHTLQDFYSHSTWVEIGNSAPNPALYGPSSIAVNRATPTCTASAACSRANTLGLLTSGYYSGNDQPPPAGVRKCDHGGSADSLWSGAGGINKDTATCLVVVANLPFFVSPHNDYHYQAADLAVRATRDLVMELRARLNATAKSPGAAAETDALLRQLLGMGGTVGIAIDVTSSMAPIIDQVKEQSLAIIDSLQGSDGEPSSYILSPFGDPEVGPLTQTANADEFRNAIRGLTAAGGGDCPEMAFTGLMAALNAADQGATVYVFTDADPKDGGLSAAAAGLAATKKIKVNFVVLGNCLPSKGPVATDATSPWEEVARASGGQIFAVDIQDVAAVLEATKVSIDPDRVDIVAIRSELPAVPKRFAADVAGSATLEVGLTWIAPGDSNRVELRRPDGSVVRSSDPGVAFSESPRLSSWRVQTPMAGTWELSVTAQGRFRVMATQGSFVLLDRADVPVAQRIIPFPVDATVRTMTIAMAGIPSDDPAAPRALFSLRDPSGVHIAHGTGGGTWSVLDGSSVYTTGAPPAGNWTLTTESDRAGTYTLNVAASSAIRLARFDFLEEAGRTGHGGYFPIAGMPIAGEQSAVSATLAGNVSQVRFFLDAASGERGADLGLSPVMAGSLTWYGMATPQPSTIPVATGLDASGYPFQRVRTNLITPSTLRILEMPRVLELRPDSTSTFKVTVRNTGSMDEDVDVLATDDHGYVGTVDPVRARIAPGQSVSFTVSVRVAAGATVGIADSVAVTARGSVSGSTNRDTVTIMVTNACLRGDVNLNGVVSAFDASLVLQYVTGAITLSSEQQCGADANENGLITALDAAEILRKVTG